MRTPASGRGGSVPPRHPAGKPQQWFTLRPWVFDVTFAGVLLRAAPRPPVPIPVEAWARAYGLARDPGSWRLAVSLIGPGPDFSPGYAMTTDPGEPVILATLAGAGGEPTPLLIDGCHRLYKAAVTGRVLPGAQDLHLGGVDDADEEPGISGGVVGKVPVHMGKVPDSRQIFGGDCCLRAGAGRERRGRLSRPGPWSAAGRGSAR